jgi:hypothetical protein
MTYRYNFFTQVFGTMPDVQTVHHPDVFVYPFAYKRKLQRNYCKHNQSNTEKTPCLICSQQLSEKGIGV